MLPWRRDRLRRCTRCGHEWRVPYRLARRQRASKWRRGISPADRSVLGGRDAMFSAAIRYQLDEAARRGREADAELALVARLRECPNCGAQAWTEERA